ncbi:agmatinase family protein [Roseivirga sp. BDSF3-8]|uniref:agmatinase family protein n=1 Tax=Roseivirga sp. BDSF3-8 TaxID=3241598 RepID=UPI003532689C
MSDKLLKKKIESFDPNGVGALGSLFGLPFEPEEATMVILPMPWEVTVSYSAGTADGPIGVLNASPQLDLYQPDIKDAWKMGLCMADMPMDWHKSSEVLRKKSEAYIHALETRQVREGGEDLKAINLECENMVRWVREHSEALLEEGKIVGLLGGDHSTPLGLLQALAARHESFGILQIDAHADLRDAYEGFTYSHASIMFNALKLDQISHLVQVGIRDICDAEVNMIDESAGRIRTFYDWDLKEEQFGGKNWAAQCDEIVKTLPDKVYVSFDIDGLDPKLCPNTGTPVPGGFSYDEAMHLIKKVVQSGRTVIGFDLCEVSPGEENEWDANVGARVLYRLANLTGVSQNLLAFK